MASCSTCSSSSTCSHSQNGGENKSCPRQFKLQDQLITRTLKAIKHKIFIVSGKGGVGKSSVTVNLAAALSAKGYKVGIMDVDLHGPSVPNLLNLRFHIEVDPVDQRLLPVRYNENLAVISMDSLLEDRNQAILWRGPKKSSAIRQFLADVQWGNLDFLFIDSPPGTGDEHITVLKSIPDAKCIVVTTPQEISLADVRKAINFLQYTNSEILGLIENMSGFFCPNCGQKINLFKKGGGQNLAENYGLEFLGAIPLDPVTVLAADRGIPVVSLEDRSHAKEAFMKLSDIIIKRVEKGANPKNA